MSDRLNPAPEAKARIQAHSEKDFLAFFDELPVAGMQRVARYLPKVDGFRQTSSLGIARQKVALARKLGRQNVTDRDLQALYMIWREWTGATFRNAIAVQELIDQVEDAAENAENEETRRLAIGSKVDALFAKLNEDSRQNLCTREQMERFFEFSPLPETPTARAMIASSKSTSDVEHDSKFNELPDRLQRLEADIKGTKAQLDAIAERSDQSLRSIAQALSDIGELRTISSQSREDVDRLRSEDQRRSSEQSRLKDDGDAREKAANAQFKVLADQIADIRAEGQALRSLMPDTARVDDMLAKLSFAVVEATDIARTANGAVSRLQTDLDRLTRDVITLSADTTINDKLVSHMARITSLEGQSAQRVSASSSAGKQSSSPDAKTESRLPILRFEPIAFRELEPSTAISKPRDIANAFATVLQSIGLRKRAAQVFGEECAAAVMARQAIFLKGAFAAQVARALAASVATGSAFRLSVPIGLENDSGLRETIGAAFADEIAQIGALSVEGIDLAPVQIVREAIADCLAARGSVQFKFRIAIFATVSDGLASHPIEKGYLELGPLFDLDVLDWRTTYSGNTIAVPRTLPLATEESFWNGLTSDSVDTSEATRLSRYMVRRPEPAVEQTIVRAFQALQLLRGEASDVTSLQSLFYGWVLPYWRLRRLAYDQVEQELDGGKVNGTEIDGRLKTLVADFAGEGGPQ